MQAKTRLPAQQLMIVGASARAATWSALRAGYRPVAIDCFADTDLRDRADVTRALKYPGDLLTAARQLPPLPWIYTGGLENHPDIVDRIAGRHELLGNAGRVLRQVRNPERLFRVLAQAGFSVPETTDSRPATGADWLVKSRRSAAGLGVRRFRAGDAVSRGCYYQRCLRGTPWSSLYLAAGNESMLLGVTRQWIGATALGGRDFLYCGSFTTSRTPAERSRLELLGQVLTREFSLSGLFGVDWIFSAGTIWPLEVNPRYTASCELLEWAHGWPLITWHVRACRGAAMPPLNELVQNPEELEGTYCKAILYAHDAMTISDRFVELVTQQNAKMAWPPIADIPAAGQRIEGGRPVVTLFARGRNRQEARARILQLAETVRGSLVM